MFKNYYILCVSILTILWSSVVFTNEAKAETTASSGGNQIIVSPINILLNLAESAYADALVLDKDGNPVEGEEIQIIPQDKTKIAISSNSFTTNESGYIQFSILGKQQGDTAIIITDGIVSTQIDIAIRDLIQHVLPYFYGNMKLSIVNPSEDTNYVQIKFHENSDRQIPPVTIRLEGKEMRNIKLSEETGVTLKDGWVEITSTEVIVGGTWTNKGYLSLCHVNGNY
ncbi:MAG: hypothetical protein ACE5H1_03750 [Thermodesulfobacteriota bacterium]